MPCLLSDVESDDEESDKESDELMSSSDKSLLSSEDEPAAFTTVDVEAVAFTHTVNGGGIVELYDSGATRHMTPYRHLLSNYTPIAPKPINAANKHVFQAVGCGDLKIGIPNDDGKTVITLRNVLYAPDIGMTLISIGLAARAGYTATFGHGSCTICDRTRKVIGRVPFKNGLYQVDWDSAEAAHVTGHTHHYGTSCTYGSHCTRCS